jgi:hypothetical protein
MREELAKAPHEIRTVPDLMYAISRAKDDEDRLRIWNRAHYLGLGSRLPGNWMPDGSLNERSGP